MQKMPDSNERNQRRQIVDRHSVFSVDEMTQYCYEVNSSHLDLQIRCNPVQSPSELSCRPQRTGSNVCTESRD